jgi:hypothetical protein
MLLVSSKEGNTHWAGVASNAGEQVKRDDDFLTPSTLAFFLSVKRNDVGVPGAVDMIPLFRTQASVRC